jgi:serine/threonine protein kinase
VSGVGWDVKLELAGGEGAGVSACEEAGYSFGTREYGVRGQAGPPGYWAPEMLHYEKDGKGRRYGPAADIWSYGCLVYSLIATRGPFTVVGGDTADDNAATLENDPEFDPAIFSPTAMSFVSALCETDPARRLGCGADSFAAIMAHPFFAGVDWVAMAAKRVPPPLVPATNVFTSTKSVRGWSDKDKAKIASVVVSPADQAKYRGVSFVSQRALYREVIQNVSLRELAASMEAASAGGESGGGSSPNPARRRGSFMGVSTKGKKCIVM